MSIQPAIGLSDFRKLRELGLAYVDKTHLVCELIDRLGAETVLLPRPRRFGKTLNISMLRCFFEKRSDGADLSSLFEGLAVWNAGPAYRAHFQRYPVIHLSFKETKHDRFEDCWAAIRKKIQSLFDEHRHLVQDGHLSESEAGDFLRILDGTAERALYESALRDLSRLLTRAHGEKVVILIDEYDEPIHSAFLNGYAREVIGFFRNFLSAGLKDNPHVARAVLTGILRIARESIFSGLNNLGVFSLLRPEFNTCFGFTGEEVRALLERAGRLDRLDDVRAHYNGYVFGGQVIYNPWSVLNWLASDDAILRNYWVATSSNELVRDLLMTHAFRVQPDIEALLAGGTIERRLDENVVLDELRARPSAMFDLLVFTGYLKAEAPPGPHREEPPYLLSIPNREVRAVYAATFQQWLEQALAVRGGALDVLLAALLDGDAEGFRDQLAAFVDNVLSYHDVPARSPERVYQAFLIGLLSALEGRGYRVRSNREAGRGRADVLVEPREAGRPGVVMELKVVKGARRPQKALADGIAQMRAKRYASALKAAGAEPVHLLAVAFNGKEVWVKGAEATPPRKPRAKAAAAKPKAGTKRGTRR